MAFQVHVGTTRDKQLDCRQVSLSHDSMIHDEKWSRGERSRGVAFRNSLLEILCYYVIVGMLKLFTNLAKMAVCRGVYFKLSFKFRT